MVVDVLSSAETSLCGCPTKDILAVTSSGLNGNDCLSGLGRGGGEHLKVPGLSALNPEVRHLGWQRVSGDWEEEMIMNK
jgi:hypothetical protein